MADKNRERRKRKEPEYDPVVRQEPTPFPESLVPTGRLELALIREDNEFWQVVTAASASAIREQAALEDLQSLTLESRIGLALMQADLLKFRQLNPDQTTFLGIRWAVAMAWVLTELLPRTGLADQFLAYLETPTFRNLVADMYEQWFLPPTQPETEVR